jgi:WD40 repeat protein
MYACKKNDKFVYTNHKTVIIRSFENPEECQVFTQHKANATVAAFSPNGEWVASGDQHGTVLVWGVKNGNVKLEYPASSMPVADLAWDSEGKRICAVGDGTNSYGKFFTWDSGNACGTVEGHIKRAIACAVNNKRPFRAVTAGEDNAIVAYNGAPFKKSHILKDHERFPNKLQFHPSGDHMVSIGSDGKIFVFDGKELTKTREISDEKGHAGAIYSFCFNDDGSKFVTCGSDKTCKIWNFESGTVEGTYTIGTDVDDQQMCVLWHKNWIVSISLSGALNYLDPSNIGTITRTIHGHMGNSNGSIATDTANKVFYTADDNGKICAWQNGLATWFAGKGHGKGIRDLSVNCDGTAVASVGLDDTLRFNETKSNELSTNGIGLGGAPTCVACGKKSADLAVVGIAQNKITVVSGGSATNTAVNYKPLCVDISPCDTKVIVGGDDKQVHLYSLSGGELKEEHVVKTHMHHVFSVRFWAIRCVCVGP